MTNYNIYHLSRFVVIIYIRDVRSVGLFETITKDPLFSVKAR